MKQVASKHMMSAAVSCCTQAGVATPTSFQLATTVAVVRSRERALLPSPDCDRTALHFHSSLRAELVNTTLLTVELTTITLTFY